METREGKCCQPGKETRGEAQKPCRVWTLEATEFTLIWLLAICGNIDISLPSKHHLKLMTVYLLKIDLGKKPIILTKLISTDLNK